MYSFITGRHVCTYLSLPSTGIVLYCETLECRASPDLLLWMLSWYQRWQRPGNLTDEGTPWQPPSFQLFRMGSPRVVLVHPRLTTNTASEIKILLHNTLAVCFLSLNFYLSKRVQI